MRAFSKKQEREHKFQEMLLGLGLFLANAARFRFHCRFSKTRSRNGKCQCQQHSVHDLIRLGPRSGDFLFLSCTFAKFASALERLRFRTSPGVRCLGQGHFYLFHVEDALLLAHITKSSDDDKDASAEKSRIVRCSLESAHITKWSARVEDCVLSSF